ncbi:MAG TPA: LUD domain-containing protein [Acidimicrobiales bacterium]|nr:LUD domain-containing protein [Acidimicrobiales bacterium]
MTGREAFLDRLRTRLAVPAPENLPHPLVPVEGVPAVAYNLDLDDPVAAFERAATAAGATVRRGGLADAGDIVAEVLATVGARTAVVAGDLDVDITLPAGVEALPFDSPVQCERADLGITGAAYGIAATGSLVLHAGAAGGRTASLLPPVHLAFLRTERLLRDAGELFRRLGERFPGGLPSQLVLVTGPSRSADIELEVTVGVHGPRQLWIGVLT